MDNYSFKALVQDPQIHKLKYLRVCYIVEIHSISKEYMVTLPLPFVAIPNYPGYFWHLTELVLYSLKVGGELRELRLNKKGFYHEEDCYTISHLGRKGILTRALLMRLNPTDSEIPVVTRAELKDRKPVSVSRNRTKCNRGNYHDYH